MVERLKEIWLDAKQMRDERGLTLIELLVVVVILGIIAAIAVVAIGGLIENSRKDAQVANAKQLVSAAKLYVSSNPIESGKLSYVTSTAGDKNVLEKYIDSLKDPMNGDGAYQEAFVTVDKNADGKYTYKVTLKKDGSQAYFNAASTLKKDEIVDKAEPKTEPQP